MKVLHISTTDVGGAGKGMMNLHLALLRSGIDSKVLVAQKQTNYDTVYSALPNIHIYNWSKFAIIRIVQRILRKCGIGLTEVELIYSKISNVLPQFRSSCYTSPVTCYDLSSNPLVQEADIIHLHWIGSFVDIESFFVKVNKPIIWTLRDENPGLGGFHYNAEKQKLGKYYKDLEEKFLSIKRQAIVSNNNLSLIALSDVMLDFVQDVDFLANKPIYKIYNAIDDAEYEQIPNLLAKSALGIVDNEFVISFVSVSLKDYRKNLAMIMKALEEIDWKYKIICVGKNDFFHEPIPENVICVGSIENSRILSLLYSASDVFITPSLQESFGKTTIEALLCGTPVISSSVGVAPEAINSNNGLLLDKISSEAIRNALIYVKEKSFNRDEIRCTARMKFKIQEVVNRHIELYYYHFEKQYKESSDKL